MKVKIRRLWTASRAAISGFAKISKIRTTALSVSNAYVQPYHSSFVSFYFGYTVFLELRGENLFKKFLSDSEYLVSNFSKFLIKRLLKLSKYLVRFQLGQTVTIAGSTEWLHGLKGVRSSLTSRVFPLIAKERTDSLHVPGREKAQPSPWDTTIAVLGE